MPHAGTISVTQGNRMVPGVPFLCLPPCSPSRCQCQIYESMMLAGKRCFRLLTGWISSVPFLHPFGVSNCQPRMTQRDMSLMLYPTLGLLWLVCHASRTWNWIFNTASFTRQGDGVWTTMKTLRCYNPPSQKYFRNRHISRVSTASVSSVSVAKKPTCSLFLGDTRGLSPYCNSGTPG